MKQLEIIDLIFVHSEKIADKPHYYFTVVLNQASSDELEIVELVKEWIRHSMPYQIDDSAEEPEKIVVDEVKIIDTSEEDFPDNLKLVDAY